MLSQSNQGEVKFKSTNSFLAYSVMLNGHGRLALRAKL